MPSEEERTLVRKSLRAESSSSSVDSLVVAQLKARLVAPDYYEIIATLVSTRDGELWQMREHKQFGRRHYYNPETGERREERDKTWMVLKNVQADVHAASDEEPEGESFVSTTNGQRYTKYYDARREEYYYVNEETKETSWEHPDGELAELAQAASGALAPVDAGEVENEAVVVAVPTLTREQHIEAKMQKLMLVEKKWLKKLPPAAPVPHRPAGFTGVYAESEKFWDPDGDTYSIDGNEGSDVGMDEHAEALDAVDALDRYVSAVDMATPSDLRPLNAAKTVFERILLAMYEMVEEEEYFRQARERRKNPEAATLQGTPISVRKVNVRKVPELNRAMEFEIGRAKAAASISEQRLKIEDSEQYRDCFTFQRLYSPMDDYYSGSVTFELEESDDDASTPPEEGQKRMGYTGASFKVASSEDDPSKATEADEVPAQSLNVKTKKEAKVSDAPPKQPRGFFGSLFGSKKERERARELADKRELAKAGYVAPWDRPASTRRVSKKRLTKDM